MRWAPRQRPGSPGEQPRANGARPHTTWEVYNGGPEAMKYSALDQINRDNVRQLTVAWTYRSGDVGSGERAGGRPQPLQSNPIVVRGTMYVLGQNNKVLALDAATRQAALGATGPTARGTATRRGLAYWEEPGPHGSGGCSSRSGRT